MLETQRKFAQRRGVCTTTVAEWRNRGHVVMVGRLVDVEQSEARLAARPKRYRGGSTNQSDESPVANEDISLSEAQRRKEAALAKMREHQLDVARGKYVAVTSVQTGWSRIVNATRNAVLEIPSNARLRLQLTDEQARGLEKMVRETLTRVAMQEPPKNESSQ